MDLAHVDRAGLGGAQVQILLLPILRLIECRLRSGILSQQRNLANLRQVSGLRRRAVILLDATLILHTVRRRHITVQSLLLHVHDTEVCRLLERVRAAQAEVLRLASRRARLRLYHLIARLNSAAMHILTDADRPVLSH